MKFIILEKSFNSSKCHVLLCCQKCLLELFRLLIRRNKDRYSLCNTFNHSMNFCIYMWLSPSIHNFQTYNSTNSPTITFLLQYQKVELKSSSIEKKKKQNRFYIFYGFDLKQNLTELWIFSITHSLANYQVNLR